MHVLCHHTQNPHHLIVPFPANPVSLINRDKAIFVLHVIKDRARHLAGHADMLVVLHAKEEESLAINLDIRRLTQSFIEIAEFFHRTIANMHVADRHRGPCWAVLSDEACEVIHVHDTRLKEKLFQRWNGGSFGKHAPGGNTVRQLEINSQAVKYGHMRERFHDLLAKAKATANMLAMILPPLKFLQHVPLFERISLQGLLISHEAKVQGHQPFQCIFGSYESGAICQTDSRSSTYNLRTLVEGYDLPGTHASFCCQVQYVVV